jgi:hypothetical protein
LNSFCKSFYSYYQDHRSEFTDDKLVSVAAINAWDDCIRLYADGGVVFEPRVLKTQLAIDIQKKSPNPVHIHGVIFNKDLLACEGSNLSNPAAAMSAVDEKTQVTLNDGSYWQVACTRKPIDIGNRKQYGQADFQILTSAGSYSLNIPADESLPPQFASEFSNQIKSMTALINNVASKTSALDCKKEAHDGQRGRYAENIIQISDADKKLGYVVVGGGCEQIDPNKNFAFIADRPDGDSGWYCLNGDAPGIAADVQNRAFIVLCRIAEMTGTMPGAGAPPPREAVSARLPHHANQRQ